MNHTGKLAIVFVLSAAAATIGCTGKGQANTQTPAALNHTVATPVEKNPLADPDYRRTLADKLFAEEGFQIDSKGGTNDRYYPYYYDTYNIRKIEDDGHMYTQLVIIDGPHKTARVDGTPQDQGRRIETLASKPAP